MHLARSSSPFTRPEIDLARDLYREFSARVANACSTNSKSGLSVLVDVINYRLRGTRLHLEVHRGLMRIMCGPHLIPG